MSDQNQLNEAGQIPTDEPVLESSAGDPGPAEPGTAGRDAPRPYESRYDAYRFRSTPDPAYRYDGSANRMGRAPGQNPSDPFSGPGPGGGMPGPNEPDRNKTGLFILLASGALLIALLIGILILLPGRKISVKDAASGPSEVQIGRQDDGAVTGEDAAPDGTYSGTQPLEADAESVPAANYAESAAEPAQAEESSREDSRVLMTAPEVIASALPSMAAITNVTVTEYEDWFGNVRKFEDVSFGSGIIVSKTDDLYLLATSMDAVTSSAGITVTFLDREESGVSAEIAGTDKTSNLAILSVKAVDIPREIREKIEVIRINRSGELRVGEPVVAIGNALGYGQSASRGILSAVNRVVTNSDGSQHVVIQTDASINPGNNGGALLNMHGELIGINQLKEIDESVEGIGYAIPMSEAYPVLEKLGSRSVRKKAESGEAAYLGIRCITMPDSYTESGYPAGAYVDDVISGGAAEKAGIRHGDIIVSIGGMDIASSDDVLEELSYHKGGEELEVVVARVSETGEETWDSVPEVETITLSVVPDARSEMAS